MRKKYLIVFIILSLSAIGVGLYLRFNSRPSTTVSINTPRVVRCVYSEPDVLNRINALRTNKLSMVGVYDDFAESRLPELRVDYSHNGYRAKLNSLPAGHFTGEILNRDACGPVLIDSWLNSPTHKAVMLDERYDSVGIAGDNTYTVVIFGDLR